MNAAELPGWYWAGFGALIGACLASFFGVVVERIPRGEGIGGRSHCACGRQLTARENVPVIGWLATGGRTRCCNVRIPTRYLVTEIAAGVIVGTAGARYSLPGLLLGSALIALVAAGMLVVAIRGRTDTSPCPEPGDGGR